MEHSPDMQPLPWLKLGLIPWKMYALLGTSCKAFSLLCKPPPVPTPTLEQCGKLPVWHRALFRDTKLNACYFPSLPHKGIRTFDQLTNIPNFTALLPRTSLHGMH